MQKVVGSSPIIRSSEKPCSGGVFCCLGTPPPDRHALELILKELIYMGQACGSGFSIFGSYLSA